MANDAFENEQPLFVNFIWTKSVGKGLDFVPTDTPNATRVIELHKNKIKFDNSKVVMGHLIALGADRNSMGNWSTISLCSAVACMRRQLAHALTDLNRAQPIQFGFCT